jgi:hypothetical protein
MDDGTYACIPNIPMIKTHVEEIGIDSEIEEFPEENNESLLDFSPNDLPFTKEEDFNTIEWPKKEQYQQLLDRYKDNKVGSVKVLKREYKDSLIRPRQDDVLFVESHPPPSRKYTRVI